MFSDWSNALNNTQHLEKQTKCWVAQHLFSEKFDRDQTSLNKTQQGWTKLNKVVKRSERFALNKCSVLFSEMFSAFDRGLRFEICIHELRFWRLSHSDPIKLLETHQFKNQISSPCEAEFGKSHVIHFAKRQIVANRYLSTLGHYISFLSYF